MKGGGCERGKFGGVRNLGVVKASNRPLISVLRCPICHGRLSSKKTLISSRYKTLSHRDIGWLREALPTAF